MDKIAWEQLTKSYREQLKKQSKEWLIERLCEFAVDDGINADRILLYLSAEKAHEDEVIVDFKGTIDKAIKQIKNHGRADWRNELPLRALYDIADALTHMQLMDKQKVVLEIAEYVLLEFDSIAEFQDECELDYLIEAFRHLQVSACYKLKSDPEALGAHLAHLANKTNWWLFDGPPKEYTEFLGQVGLAAYASARKKKVVGSL